MIVADTESPDGRKGLLVAIPFDEMRAAVEQGRALQYTADGPGKFDVVVIFGASHEALIATIKGNAMEVRGEENLR